MLTGAFCRYGNKATTFILIFAAKYLNPCIKMWKVWLKFIDNQCLFRVELVQREPGPSVWKAFVCRPDLPSSNSIWRLVKDQEVSVPFVFALRLLDWLLVLSKHFLGANFKRVFVSSEAGWECCRKQKETSMNSRTNTKRFLFVCLLTKTYVLDDLSSCRKYICCLKCSNIHTWLVKRLKISKTFLTPLPDCLKIHKKVMFSQTTIIFALGKLSFLARHKIKYFFMSFHFLKIQFLHLQTNILCYKKVNLLFQTKIVKLN